MVQISQYPKDFDNRPLDINIGVLTDASGNGGARMAQRVEGPDRSPIDTYGFVLLDKDGNIIIPADAKTPDRFGAKGGGVDDAVALQAWADSGGLLFLPDKEYYSTQTIIWRKRVHVIGAGYAFDARALVPQPVQGIVGSRIRFAPGVRGFDIQPQTALTDIATVLANINAAFTQEGAAYSEFRDFALIGGGGAAAEGWHQRTICYASNIYVTNFSSHGYHITSTSDIPNADDEYGSTSNSHLLNCHAVFNGGDGIKVQGRDAGSSTFTNFEARSNGGWGINSQELFGSEWIKPILHANANAIRTTNSACFDIPYVEADGGQTCSLYPSTTFVGSDFTGLAGSQKPAMFAGRTTINNLTINWNFNGAYAMGAGDYGMISGDASYGLVFQGKSGSVGSLGFINQNGVVVAYAAPGASAKDWYFKGPTNVSYSNAIATLNITDEGSTNGSHIQLYASGARRLQLLAFGSDAYISADNLIFRDNATAVDQRFLVSSTGVELPAGKTLKVNGAARIKSDGNYSAPPDAYSASWDGNNDAPTKNDVYDKIEALAGSMAMFKLGEVSPTGNSASFTGIPATYRDLILIITGRTNEAVTLSTINLTINNDTGTNYDWERLTANNATLGGLGTAAANNISAAMAGGNAPADVADMLEFVISHYRSPFHKTLVQRGTAKSANAAASLNLVERAGWWRNTAVINRLDVTIATGGANFVSGTLIALYARI